MFASDSFLHFILDADHDIHYTDSLIALTPEAYVWYELRRQDPGQNILLLSTLESGQIRIEVFDSGSRQFLIPPQKRFFSFTKQEQEPRCIAHSTYSLEDAKLTASDLLSKLLSAAIAKSANRKTALVFTLSTFEQVCREANSDGVRLMNDLLKSAGKCRLFIRLSLQADQLEDLLRADTSDCPLLSRTYERLRTALSVSKDELLRTMEALMGDQLIRLDRAPEEMMNLLLMGSVADPQSADTLEQLTDQAEYLEQCRLHRIGPLAPSSELEKFTPISRRQLGTMVQNVEFRETIRRNTAQLRSVHAHGTITHAMQQENLLPPAPPCPVYDDELSRMVLSLSLPNSCSRKAIWDASLDQIKRNLTTLWNKPRNPAAVQAARELCNDAHGAILSKNWECMEEIVVLLKFFSAQICAPAEQDKALNEIYEDGRTTIKLCNNLYGSHSFGRPEGIEGIAHMGSEAGEKVLLESLKALVRRSIQRFERPGIDFNTLSDKILADRERTYEDARQSNRNYEALREREQQQQQELELQRRKEELERKYTLGAADAIEPEDFSVNNFDAHKYLLERDFL